MTWSITLASLVGMWLNVRGSRWCFPIWGVTNAAWIAIDFRHGIPEQAVLQAVYLVASVYGWFHWSKKFRKAGAPVELGRA